ncbi:hypothetical protein [Streptomyces sp. NPDC004788]
MPRKPRRRLAQDSAPPPRGRRRTATGDAAPPEPSDPFVPSLTKSAGPWRPVHTIRVSTAFL